MSILGNDRQVYFRFERTGVWPPVPSEGLRVEDLGDGTYRVTEVPFFVLNIGLGDVVRAEVGGIEKVLWAGERVSWGGHQTVRVNPRRDTGGPDCAEVLELFGGLGVGGETLEEYALVALDVPPGVDPVPVKRLLDEGLQAQRWWFEEACIGPSWPARVV